VSGGLSVIGPVGVTGTVTAAGFSGNGAGLTGLPTAVTLTDSTSMTSSTVAASATAVMAAYNLANAAVPSSGGFVSGTLGVGKNTFPVGGNPDYGYTLDVSGNLYIAGTSNIMAGTLAVGKNHVTNNTYALDVSGSVNATSMTVGNVAFKVYYYNGTFPSSGSFTMTLPSYITYANVISATGGTSSGNVWLSFSWFYDTAWSVSVQIQGNTLTLFNTGTNTPSKPFYLTIIYY